MIAEPPPLPAPVFTPGKEAEIADLAQQAADASAETAALTFALTEAVQKLFTALSPEKQGELLTRLAKQDTAEEALHPLASSFGALKDDPLWDEYETALREIKAEDRRRAQEMYPEIDDEAA